MYRKPWSERFYEQTRIDKSGYERRFCSERLGFDDEAEPVTRADRHQLEQ